MNNSIVDSFILVNIVALILVGFGDWNLSTVEYFCCIIVGIISTDILKNMLF